MNSTNDYNTDIMSKFIKCAGFIYGQVVYSTKPPIRIGCLIGCVLWHSSPCKLFNAKNPVYVYRY